MSGPDQVIRGRRVLVGDALVPASIVVERGVIAGVGGYADDVPDGCPIVDAGDAVVMAGVVDTHVHVNEPGRSEWEGYATATRAAAAGGVTTLVDMPLNSIPPTTTPDGFDQKRAAASGQCVVDVGFWGGVVPGNADALAPLASAGVLGFKCFLVHSGVDEFPHVVESDLRPAMARLADIGRPLLVHAEVPEPIARAEAAQAGLDEAAHRRFSTFLASRPAEAEDRAIEMMIRLARDTGAAVHIVHHASAGALAMIERARDEGLPLTAETCPHYLHFCAEDIPDGATQFKCTPPIRSADNREKLWGALGAGVLDMVVSDHSPCSPDLKRMDAGSFRDAWGGIASLQLGLPVMWTEARTRGIDVPTLSAWMSAAPARLAGLGTRKGAIARGMDADLVVWNPDATFTVAAAGLQHRHAVTPYDGETLYGVVERTFCRGREVYDGSAVADDPRGELILTT